MRSNPLGCAIPLACLFALAPNRGSIAQGAMILTPEGIARGLTLSTFASGFQGPSGGSVVYLPDGQILSVDGAGRLRRFDNVDGQNAASTPVIYSYGTGGRDLAVTGGQTYMINFHSVVRIDTNSGAILNTIFTAGPQGTHYQALATHPTNGWLLVSVWGPGVYLVNPANGQYNTPFGAGTGMQVTPEGAHMYAATLSGHLYRWNVGGSGFIDYGAVPGNYQGSWPEYQGTCGPHDVTLGFGALSGRLFTSCEDGSIVELNLETLTFTQLAAGGSGAPVAPRIAVDPSGNGDILIMQSDRILRLSGIPEPASLSLLAIGSLLVFRRRRLCS